ncbi:MAG TPA: YibE/F family protein, partial [Opitutales bacterium]|nr:YibE/F family protein [Opitutales bacterium]
KAVLSFVFAALMIWKVLIPLFLAGWNPLLVGMPVLVLIAACICFLVGGLGRRGLTAFLGTVLGLFVTLGLALVCTRSLHIHGAVYHHSETLLYSGFPDLRLTPLFISGIVIGCSGAVMDLAMDIASAMEEIKLQNPAISRWAHIRSGLSVGKAVTGTMTTTLLLAYSSSALAMLMLFYAQGLPLVRIVNINSVSAEILNIVIGSIGAVSVAPFTAFVGGYVWRGRRGAV